MVEITLPIYKPRWYQIPPMRALDNGVRNVLLCWGRRSGKDCFTINHVAKTMAQKVGVYFYILPSYAQGKKVIWDSITNDGFKMLDYIPPELRANTNAQEMKITLKNGSIFQVIGSQNYDSLMGTNPRMVVFSEFALQDKQAYEYIQPILAANPNSVQIIVSTPRGYNHFYRLYQYAKNNPEWYCDLKTSLETGVISEEFIAKERERGVDEGHLRQEYYCDFQRGVEGSFFARQIDRARIENRIGIVYPQDTLTYAAFDLGMNDDTTIWMWQHVGQEIHFIDYYQCNSEPLSHYVQILKSKPYIWGDVFCPHDVQVRELGSGLSRLDTFRNLGINPIVVPNIPLMDGIDLVRQILPRCWFDEKKCNSGIESLEMYNKEYNEKHQVYNERPVHSKFSHAADGMRYAAIAIMRTLGNGYKSNISDLNSRYAARC